MKMNRCELTKYIIYCNAIILLVYYYVVMIAHPKAQFLEPAEQITTTIPYRNYWFLEGGTEYPEKCKQSAHLFPEGQKGDRIVEQLMYVPQDYDEVKSKEKLILIYGQSMGTNVALMGSQGFKDCPVNKCYLTRNKSVKATADAIIFNRYFYYVNESRQPKQVWIFFGQESPGFERKLYQQENIYNWTSTYRRDSDIVAPYGRWHYYDPEIKFKESDVNYAANKLNKAIMFVSHCSKLNGRLNYAKQLSKYIEVDIYGRCGKSKCKEKKICREPFKDDYKFYLAFENSNCRDYITEKYFRNAVGNDILPIVMGAPPEDYEQSVPVGSYVHVNNFSDPKTLAEFLHKLGDNDTLYNEYFKWKGTGEFINTEIWCRLCAMLHSPIRSKSYENINKWWRTPNMCNKTVKKFH